jgi:hypothetical protein
MRNAYWGVNNMCKIFSESWRVHWLSFDLRFLITLCIFKLFLLSLFLPIVKQTMNYNIHPFFRYLFAKHIQYSWKMKSRVKCLAENYLFIFHSLWNICVTNDPGYVPLVINTSQCFPHSWLITEFATRLTRRVSLMEQSRTAYPSGAPEFTTGFSGVRVARSLVLCVCFVGRCLTFCAFSFGHNVMSIQNSKLNLFSNNTYLKLLYIGYICLTM